MNKKKWLTLSLIGTALLLIPRRSSRQTLPATHDNYKGPNSGSNEPDKGENNHQTPNHR